MNQRPMQSDQVTRSRRGVIRRERRKILVVIDSWRRKCVTCHHKWWELGTNILSRIFLQQAECGSRLIASDSLLCICLSSSCEVQAAAECEVDHLCPPPAHLVCRGSKHHYHQQRWQETPRLRSLPYLSQKDSDWKTMPQMATESLREARDCLPRTG